MWTRRVKALLLGGVASLLLVSQLAAVTPEEAAQLKTTLTPLGAEKAGNADGTIPAWTGGYTTPIPGFKNGGRRPDPWPNDKPLFSITAKNMGQYADKLTDGTKSLFKRYPEKFRLDVYQTRRTAVAPQWFYDNTFKNATRAKLVASSTGPMPQNFGSGIPFPIPKNGAEVIWNAMLRWTGYTYRASAHSYLVGANGNRVLIQDAIVDTEKPFGTKDATMENTNSDYFVVIARNIGPPIRAGEAVLGRQNVDDTKSGAWVYLTGQRRVRKLPNACCDTPNPVTEGMMSFDEFYTFNSRLERFDWKIVGKKEMYIPYNCNRMWVPTKDTDTVGEHFLNPEYLRWELHRVWVVEADLAPGKRHQVHKNVYYVDEDTWFPVFGDRWDSSGRLWRTIFTLPMAAPDIPGTIGELLGFYDQISGAYYVAAQNELSEQVKVMPPYRKDYFTPDALSQLGLR